MAIEYLQMFSGLSPFLPYRLMLLFRCRRFDAFRVNYVLSTAFCHNRHSYSQNFVNLLKCFVYRNALLKITQQQNEE
jgi:hypothetical protein